MNLVQPQLIDYRSPLPLLSKYCVYNTNAGITQANGIN